GQRPVTLLQAKKPTSTRTRIEEAAWRDVDEELFQQLRALRRDIAIERGVAAFVVMHDSTLRDLAMVRPTTLEGLRSVRGMGERKLADFGPRLLECIASHEQERRTVASTDPNSTPDEQSG